MSVVISFALAVTGNSVTVLGLIQYAIFHIFLVWLIGQSEGEESTNIPTQKATT